MDTCTHASLSVCVSNTQEEGGKKKTPTDVNRSKSIKASAVMELRRLWPVSSPDINQSPRSQQGAKVRPRTAPSPRAPSRCSCARGFASAHLSRCVQGSGNKSAGWKFTPIQTKDGLFYACLDPSALCSPRGNLSPPSHRPSQEPGRRRKKTDS